MKNKEILILDRQLVSDWCYELSKRGRCKFTNLTPLEKVIDRIDYIERQVKIDKDIDYVNSLNSLLDTQKKLKRILESEMYQTYLNHTKDISYLEFYDDYVSNL